MIDKGTTDTGAGVDELHKRGLKLEDASTMQ